MEQSRQAVFAAADRLIDAFARHDRDAYFSAFAPEATFIFHTLDRPLKTRAEYEEEWALWERRDGFRVLSCQSGERNVQIAGNIGIFTHSVETRVIMAGAPSTSRERETIVFEQRPDGRWLAIHEHLSPAA